MLSLSEILNKLLEAVAVVIALNIGVAGKMKVNTIVIVTITIFSILMILDLFGGEGLAEGMRQGMGFGMGGSLVSMENFGDYTAKLPDGTSAPYYNDCLDNCCMPQTLYNSTHPFGEYVDKNEMQKYSEHEPQQKLGKYPLPGSPMLAANSSEDMTAARHHVLPLKPHHGHDESYQRGMTAGHCDDDCGVMEPNRVSECGSYDVYEGMDDPVAKEYYGNDRVLPQCMGVDPDSLEAPYYSSCELKELTGMPEDIKAHHTECNEMNVPASNTNVGVESFQSALTHAGVLATPHTEKPYSGFCHKVAQCKDNRHDLYEVGADYAQKDADSTLSRQDIDCAANVFMPDYLKDKHARRHDMPCGWDAHEKKHTVIVPRNKNGDCPMPLDDRPPLGLVKTENPPEEPKDNCFWQTSTCDAC